MLCRQQLHQPGHSLNSWFAYWDNGDGIVDAVDMCIIVDNWGTDDPLCDIGPTPFGDGIVDVEDLIVLAEHLFEEIPPAEPID